MFVELKIFLDKHFANTLITGVHFYAFTFKSENSFKYV